jgi:hypothetical protein
MKVDGRCHCGAITYRAEIDPETIVVCHCTDCQALTGTAFNFSVPTKPGSFALLSGTPKRYVKTAQSGNERVQGFCPECGSPIYSTSTGTDPAVYRLRVGTLRQRGELRPRKQYWCRSALGWVNELGSLPRADQQ